MKNKMSFTERFISVLLEKNFRRWVVILYIVLFAVYGYYEFFLREIRVPPTDKEVAGSNLVVTLKRLDSTYALVSQIAPEVSSLKDRVTKLENQVPLSPDDSKELRMALRGVDPNIVKNLSVGLEQLNGIHKKLQNVAQDMSDLKNAINPTNPSEILTVVRLGDKFDLLNSEITTLRNEIADLKNTTDLKIQRNYELVDAQVDRIVDMVKWMLLLLIPIIFTTIKDFLKGRRDESQKTKGSSETN